MYKHEMKLEDHIELLEILKEHPGPVILSGYNHELYEELLSDWKKEDKVSYAEAGATRTEVLWINPVATENGYKQQSLF